MNKLNRLFPGTVIESFFSCWALMKLGRFESGNIVTGIFFIMSCYLFYHINVTLAKKEYTRLHQQVSFLLAFFFTIFYVGVDYVNYISGLTNHLFQAIILGAVSLGLFTLLYKLILLLYSYTTDVSHCTAFLQGLHVHSLSDTRFHLLHKLTSFVKKHPFCFATGFCMLCWMPYFLYEYPGIMTPDSINQFEQVLGVIPYSNHHPWVHTLLIKLFYDIGSLFTDDMVVAISFYTFFQMLTMACIVGYFIATLIKLKVRSGICIAFVLFYALVPFHAVFVVTLWKDVLFAGGVLLFTTTLLRLTRFTTRGDFLLYFVAGVMLCLLRSNGWYAFLVTLPFLLYYFRKQWKVMVPVQLGILLLALLVKYPIMNACQVEQPDFIESLSIPTQQIAAVICNDRELTQEQWNLVHHVIDTTYIKELYDATFADNMKELVRAGHQEYLVAHKAEYLQLWLQLLVRYPFDYLKAYTYQTFGYWYPDSFYKVADIDGISGSDLGISHTPLIGGPLVIKAKEISIKLGSMIPLYSLLWSMGVLLWVFLLCIGNSWIRKERLKLIFYLPGFMIMLTVLIATPVATEFRYVYFLVYTLPLYLVVSLLPKS